MRVGWVLIIGGLGVTILISGLIGLVMVIGGVYLIVRKKGR